jgi:hypothetical protein
MEKIYREYAGLSTGFRSLTKRSWTTTSDLVEEILLEERFGQPEREEKGLNLLPMVSLANSAYVDP